jgi:TonB family protein
MVTAIAPIRYGAPELRRLAHRYTGAGLSIALIFHFAGIGAFWLSLMMGNDEKVPPREMSITTLGPPPTIRAEQLPQVAVATETVRPSVGIPVPVPDAQVSPDKTIEDQRAMSAIAGPASTGEIRVTGNSQPVSDDSPPPIFRAVEKYPEIIRQVVPAYPELAVKVGLEGRVFVRVWVDKDGKPKKAVVIRSDAEIFNDSALQAAMQYRFTPAIMNKGPVSVWMTIPFVFKLKH